MKLHRNIFSKTQTLPHYIIMLCQDLLYRRKKFPKGHCGRDHVTVGYTKGHCGRDHVTVGYTIYLLKQLGLILAHGESYCIQF